MLPSVESWRRESGSLVPSSTASGLGASGNHEEYGPVLVSSSRDIPTRSKAPFGSSIRTCVTRCYPQCGSPILDIQTGCLGCGTLATYESRAARSILSVDALLSAEEDAMATAAAGLAVRVGTSAPSPVTAEDEEQIMDHKEDVLARLMEYGGSKQLFSMPALMANAIWSSIEARLAWHETPTRAPDDKT